MARDIYIEITWPIDDFDNRDEGGFTVCIELLGEPPGQLEADIEIEDTAIGWLCRC